MRRNAQLVQKFALYRQGEGMLVLGPSPGTQASDLGPGAQPCPHPSPGPTSSHLEPQLSPWSRQVLPGGLRRARLAPTVQGRQMGLGRRGGSHRPVLGAPSSRAPQSSAPGASTWHGWTSSLSGPASAGRCRPRRTPGCPGASWQRRQSVRRSPPAQFGTPCPSGSWDPLGTMWQVRPGQGS